MLVVDLSENIVILITTSHVNSCKKSCKKCYVPYIIHFVLQKTRVISEHVILCQNIRYANKFINNLLIVVHLSQLLQNLACKYGIFFLYKLYCWGLQCHSTHMDGFWHALRGAIRIPWKVLASLSRHQLVFRWDDQKPNPTFIILFIYFLMHLKKYDMTMYIDTLNFNSQTLSDIILSRRYRKTKWMLNFSMQQEMQIRCKNCSKS